jgi:hypothetical protein
VSGAAVTYRGGVAAASDRPGRNGDAFKGARHPTSRREACQVGDAV